MQIDKVQFAQVVETAKAKSAGSPRWIRAIEKASEAILNGELISQPSSLAPWSPARMAPIW